MDATHLLNTLDEMARDKKTTTQQMLGAQTLAKRMLKNGDWPKEDITEALGKVTQLFLEHHLRHAGIDLDDD